MLSAILTYNVIPETQTHWMNSNDAISTRPNSGEFSLIRKAFAYFKRVPLYGRDDAWRNHMDPFFSRNLRKLVRWDAMRKPNLTPRKRRYRKKIRKSIPARAMWGDAKAVSVAKKMTVTVTLKRRDVKTMRCDAKATTQRNFVTRKQ